MTYQVTYAAINQMTDVMIMNTAPVYTCMSKTTWKPKRRCSHGNAIRYESQHGVGQTWRWPNKVWTPCQHGVSISVQKFLPKMVSSVVCTKKGRGLSTPECGKLLLGCQRAEFVLIKALDQGRVRKHLLSLLTSSRLPFSEKKQKAIPQ